MHYLFYVLVHKKDDRIWRVPFMVNAGVQQSAEKITRDHFGDYMLHIEFKAKADEHDDKKYEKYSLDWLHEGIVPVKTLGSLGINIPPNQSVPFVYPDGKTPNQVMKEEETIIEVEEEIKPKFKLMKCEWCKQEIPKNGAAQFSHLKKHLSELVEKGALTARKAKSIRSTKLDKKIRRIFHKEFGRS